MAVRVTADEVKEIIDTELSDTRINSFVIASHNTIESNLLNKGLEEDLLKEIERWLSAHYITAFERQAIEEEAGPVSQKFANVFDKGLDSSTYGQTVKMLDKTGILENLNGKKIKIVAISE